MSYSQKEDYMAHRPKPHWKPQPAAVEPRSVPQPPDGLGDSGRETWEQLWKLYWLVPDRHSQIVTRYCRLQDLLAASFDQLTKDGYMIEGSHGRLRAHHALTEIRQLATESRRTEVELGLTPGSESKAGVAPQPAPSRLDALREARRRDDGDDNESMVTLLGGQV